MRKINHFFLLLSVVPLVIYYYSCDDSGVGPHAFTKGIINLTAANLRPLNPSVEGVYQLWVVFDTSTGNYYRNAGSFNISQSGGIIDMSGNPMAFNLYEDTANVGFAQFCFISIGTDTTIFTNPRLLAGTFGQYSDSASANLRIEDANAVGPALDPVIASSGAWYMLNQPTTNNAVCQSGVWFCDTLGNSYLPSGMGLNSSSSQWVYQGWVADTSNPSNPIYYSMGKFYDPYSADMDGAGPCAGTIGTPYNKPGQDWVLVTSGCPGSLNLMSGKFQVFITIEPVNENGTAQTKPFFVKLFWQNYIAITQCGWRDNVHNQAVYGRLPRGHIQITK